MLNDNLIVKEVQKETTSNGLIMKYDDDNPYMFVKLAKDLPEEYANEIGVELYELPDTIFVIKRVAKIPFMNDFYIVSKKDVIAYMSKKEFEEV